MARQAGGTKLALLLTGFGTFLNLYAPQPLLPFFRDVFHASELQASLTVSATVLAVALTAPLTGLLADRLGRKGVIVGAMLGLALATALTATARTLPQIIAWRFLQGLCVPGVIAVMMAYVSEESPADAVGARMATYITGNVLGGFAGRFLTGMLTPVWGWQAAFLLLSGTTFGCAAVTGLRLPRATHFVRQRTAAAALQAVGSHLRNPQLVATYAVGFNVLCSMTATFTYVNFYLADAPFGLGPAALSAIFGVYLFGAAVTPLAGRAIDQFGYRRALLGAVGLSAGGICLTLSRLLGPVILGLALLATGVFACQAAASSHVGRAAGHARSSAAGLYVSLYYLGGAVGSVAPGLLWNQAGWGGCVAFVVVVQGVTTLLVATKWKA